MIRILFLHGGGSRPASLVSTNDTEVTEIEMVGDCVLQSLEGASAKADAVIVAPDGMQVSGETLAGAMRGAGVPVVWLHPENVEAEDVSHEGAEGATVVVHGFGTLSLLIAVDTARCLAKRALPKD